MKKSEILNEGLVICEMACRMRKDIANHKKQLTQCETDEDVITVAPKYWDEQLMKIEAKMTILSEHLKEYTKWSFYDFWMKKMKHAVDFDKDIHFFPNKVNKFIDWARYAVDNSLNK